MKTDGKWMVMACGLMAGLLLVTGCFDSGGGGGDDHDFGDNDPNKIVCMGDSITQGGNGEEGPPWPTLLANMSGKSTVNEGRGGELSSEGAGRIGGVLSREKPGYVVIFYGANDAIFGFGADYVMDQITRMVNSARVNQSIPIVCTVLPTYGTRAFANDRTAEYSVRIRALCSELGVRCADVRAEFEGDESLMLDGLHPNDTGLTIIAMVVNDQI